MEGRFHMYEGYRLDQITLPVRVMKALGAELLMVSNACGGMNPNFQAGDIMLIEDHINLMGANPLIGINDDRLETRAEYRFLRQIGADVVGMSTVPEVIVAVHSQMRTVGFSVITDMCLPDALEAADVQKIIAVANDAEPRLTTLLSGVLERDAKRNAQRP
jgi:purine-nucleoside phosphorylase